MIKKKIVLITIDALRAKNISCLGYHRNTTPYIDRLAKKGVLFSQAFSNGPTTPFSFPSIMASIYPLRLQGIGLPKSGLKTLAEILKSSAFSTAAWHPNAFISGAYHYNRGFDLFMDPETWSTEKEKMRAKVTYLIRKWPKIHSFVQIVNNNLLRRSFSFTQKNAEDILKATIHWLKSCEAPFFIWMHLNDVHLPWFPRIEYLSRFRSSMISPRNAKKLSNKLNKNPNNIWENVSKNEIDDILDLYDSEIAYVDDKIGQFLDTAIVLDNTIIIITSDHGEEFGEHNGFHCNKPYDEMLHVPLIMAGNDLPQGLTVNKQVSLIDLAPTVVNLCGLPEVKEFQGSSLLPVINNKEESRIVISECSQRLLDGESFEGEIYAIREGGWKFIIRESGDELYHLETDPGEQTNLVNQRPERAKDMKAKLTEHISEQKKNKIVVEEVELNETLKKNLRGLGYLD